MSESEQSPSAIPDDEEPEETPGYKPPAQKTLEEIQKLDAEDESLVRYKQALLAGAEAAGAEGGPNVIVQKLTLVVEGRPDIEVDLTGDLTKLKEKAFVIKEAAEYRLKITFLVQRDIVSGLRLHQVTYRKGIKVDKTSFMVGSYGPKKEPHTFLTPSDEAPKGMLARGHYVVKSKFIDDDKHVHLEWEWAFDIKKDWE
ncbi:rho GDP-dissociation inhibitor 1-like [Actinia tenebrosa]|uniref:Rho GDP-dissociation inhibitor 3 n=1 Tax=Actinia tenebrosa TaxID=6105 RepID=A0A6P8HUR1_ACTTE|nr:rho GDP-dissociation inhibitor 1-like [Actinia tenebrosa]